MQSTSDLFSPFGVDIANGIYGQPVPAYKSQWLTFQEWHI